MYVLASAPSQPNDNYDVLQDVFSGSEFDEDEAVDVIVNVLEVSASEAQQSFSALRNQGVIVEV